MATELTTVFLPLINETRMAEYLPGDFQLHPHLNDPGIDIVYFPLEWDDRSVFMIAPGEVFFIAAGTSMTFTNGPEVSAPADKNVVLVHVMSTYEWAPILVATGQPVAEWWGFEGITSISFELFLDTYDLETLATSRGFADGGELRAAILASTASLNVLLSDKQPSSFGVLGSGVDDPVTLGVRTWASYETGLTELDALSSLATMKQLAPGLENHPLIANVLSEINNTDVTIHVRFVYWQPNEVDAACETDKGQFTPVPAGSKISLQKCSPTLTYTTIVEETVVDNGQVALSVPRIDLTSVDLINGERLVFRVELPASTKFTTQYQHQQKTRVSDQFMSWGIDTDAWITYDRPTTDNSITSLDFLISLESTIVGSSNQPLEYYAGIPVFLQIQYPVVYYEGDEESADFQQEIRKAPKGLLIEILSSGITLGEFRTDEHGQVWGSILQANEADVSLDVRVNYEMEDETIKLLPIRGEVSENNVARNSYEGSFDHYTGEPFFTRMVSSIGTTAGNLTATGLATLQIGSVTITNTAGVSKFESLNGRDAGVIYALQQIRYIHQWFYYLTEGFGYHGSYQSWSAILARHDGGIGHCPSCPPADQNYTIALPYVRVTEPLFGDDETRFGEVKLLPTPDNQAVAWWLILYGHDSFTMNRKMAGKDVALPNKVQFWRDHTIWHEFTHAVLNMVFNLAFDLDMYGAIDNAKFPLTSGRINEPIPDGWSTLEEAVAAISEVTLSGKFSGIGVQLSPNPTASPRYVAVYDRQRDIGVLLNDGMNVPTVLDWRLGLRVPIAFTFGLWTALQQLAGYDTIYNIFGGPPSGNDLRDTITSLADTNAKRIFENLIWGPLIALGTPQDPGPPHKWDDLDGSQPGFTATDSEGKGGAGPVFGATGSRRIRINGPSTHRFMEVMQQQFWVNFNLGEQDQLRDLFGDVDDLPNVANMSFYLWFDF
jgi:hypothetical protein